MKRLHVLFDAKCELCRRVRFWLEGQQTFVPLAFVPLQAPDLEERFPGITALEPARQILVVSDSGDVWRGADAWIMCLWALREYRLWSQRLASPLLRPFARRICESLSRNRHRFNPWFQRSSASEIAAQLASENPAEVHSCREDTCAVP
jgi:predicted DCC family thiol-disulfide oxidoreductase YuxK